MNFLPWKKRNAVDDPLPPIEFVNGEPSFRIFVLGTGSAGKTVFLASLYNQLSIFNNRNCYRVELESEDHKNSLKRKYEEISRPDAAWPEGTMDATDYEFQCIYPARNKDFPVFRFKYVDFPGGAVTAKRTTEDDFSVKKAGEVSHTILVLIDGYKVYKKLSGIDDGGPTVDDDFSKTLDIIQPWIRRPLQFVITKHDLLKGYDLEKIRAVLMENEGFRRVVRLRRELAIATHLIPVSAVGDEFAEWDGRSSRMRKKRGASPNPYNIDLTLALTISDALLTRFKQQEGQADFARRALIKAALHGRKSIDWLATVLPWIYEDIWVLRIISLWGKLSNKVEGVLTPMQDRINERLGSIKDKNSAIENIIEIQRMLHTEFYQANRASNLLEDV